MEATRRLVEIRSATGISEVSGGGILCTIGHRKIVVGRRNFLVEHGVPASSLPVSYTHLDVYKRQVMAIVSTLMVGEYWATIVIVIMMVGGEALELSLIHI